MQRRFFRGLAQGQAEMKKTGSKRVSGYESGLGSAVLAAPGEGYASEAEGREPEGRGTRRGPAPAGALQRGYGSDSYDDASAGSYAQDEPEYVPRRGNLRLRFRGMPRSVSGRIVLGVVVFGVLAAVAVAFAGVQYYLMHDARFVLATSDDIQITGAEHLTRDQVLNVFGADLERNIFRASLAERQADLERLPWVAHATVMRLLPNVLRVQITERTPVAFVRQGSQIGLVDGGGVLLDMPPDAAGDPHYSFPVLTGLSANETLPERATKMEIYQQFMRDLDSTGGHLTDSVSEVDVSDAEDVKALVTSGSSDILVHFGQEQFLKRYQEFEQHLQEWKEQYPKLASADMRYEGQIVLEMQGDGDSAAGGGVATVATASVENPAPVVAKPVAAAKAVALKVAATKPPVLKPAAPKPASAPKTVVALKPAASKTGLPKPVILNAAGSNSPVAKPAAPKPVTLNAAASKPVALKPIAAPKLVASKGNRPVAKKFVAKRVVGKPRPGSGVDAANQKVFAQLAAAHRAALAKEHKTEMVKVAKNGKAGVKSGVTP
jgi:cell division protein FtsQ